MSPRPIEPDEFTRRLNSRIERAKLEHVASKRELPDGIVSIVFTDVVESTAMVHELGD